ILVRLEWTMTGASIAEGELVVSRSALPSSLAAPPVREVAPGVEAPTQREIGAWLRRLVLVTPDAALLLVQTPILGVGADTAGTVSLLHADGFVLRCDIAGTPGRERLVVRAVESCSLRVGALRFIEIPRRSQLRVVSQEAAAGSDLALLAPVDHMRLRGWLEYELRRDQLDEERFRLREERPLEFNEVDPPYGDKPTYPLRVVAADDERLKGWCDDLFGELRRKVSIAAELRSLDGSARPITGTVVAVRARAAAIEASFSPRDPSARLFARGRICATLDQGRARERERRRSALERLVAGAVASPDLLRCLLDPAAVKGEGLPSRMAPRPGARALNDAQRAAVERVLAGHPITLVQGPPGTGKTQVIAEIVMQLRDRRRGIRGAEAVDAPLRVLVSSVQNDAVENALKRLAADGVEVFRRVSRERRTGDESEGEILAARLEASLARDPQYARRAGVDALLRRVRVLQDVVDAAHSDEALADAMRGVFEDASAAVLADAMRSDLDELLRTVPLASATRAESQVQSTIPDARLQPPSLEDGEAQAASIDEFVRVLEQVSDDAHALAAAQWRRTQRALLRAVRQGEIEPSLIASWHQARERTPTQPRNATATATTSRWRGEVAAWVHRARHALEAELVEADRSEAAVLRAWIETLRYEPGALRRMKERHAPVVAATCQLAAPDREPDAEDLFDLVIIDEAARAGIDVFIPMGLGRQVVLVGDHQQLPPHVEEEVAARMEQEIREAAPPSESLFRWLWERLPETHRVALQCQYRMHEDIGSVVSEVFYEPELTLRHHHTGAMAARRAPCFGLFGDRAMVWIDTSAAVRDDATRRRHKLTWPIAEANEYEVEIVLEILRRADRAALRRMQEETGTQEVVGVIPFYSQQVARVHQRLQGLDLELHKMVRTGTVDSFQGMEFPLVILSCVRSNADGSVGFLRLPQRVNVALSRAQRQVVVVGDVATVGRDPEHPFGKVLTRLRQRAGAVRSSSEVIS
ncbi:MAG: AAA family ATPase, partial [Polyangiaceae bacterium]|nr:AAA family ATPase [Polyangiaceae bacterium]